MFGRALQVDSRTITRARVSFARLCVEVDISRPLPTSVTIEVMGEKLPLKIKWDKNPLFCSECRHVGHTAETCYAFGRRAKPAKKDYTQGAPPQGREEQPPGNRGAGTQHREGQQPHRGDEHSHGFQVSDALLNKVSEGWSTKVPSRGGNEARPRPGTGSHSTQMGSTQKSGPPSSFFPAHSGQLPFAESSAAAAERERVGVDAASQVPKSRRRRSQASLARKRKNQKEKKRQAALSGAVSEGGGAEKYVDPVPIGDVRGGSLSPSHRSHHVVGPLALVVAPSNNMFGPLQDDFADDEESEDVEISDTRMIEASDSRTRALESQSHTTGYHSPPAEGRQKKARHSASGAY